MHGRILGRLKRASEPNQLPSRSADFSPQQRSKTTRSQTETTLTRFIGHCCGLKSALRRVQPSLRAKRSHCLNQSAVHQWNSVCTRGRPPKKAACELPVDSEILFEPPPVLEAADGSSHLFSEFGFIYKAKLIAHARDSYAIEY